MTLDVSCSVNGPPQRDSNGPYSQGGHRAIGVKTHEGGLYVQDMDLWWFEDGIGGSDDVMPAGMYVQVVLTRDASGVLTIYADGVQQFSLPDPDNEGVISVENILTIYRDDIGSGDTENSAGSVARIRLYDDALTPSEVAQLDRLWFTPDVGWPATPVEATGQVTCFDDTGVTIPCAGTGQDGETQAGVELTSPRFADLGDGTIRDNATGLIWLRDASCAELPGVDSEGRADFDTALSAAAGLANGMCGLDDGSVAGDWHLPNVKELQSLIHFEYVWPALSNAAGDAQATDGDPFVGVETSPAISDFYWTSTNLSVDGTFGWRVDVGWGLVVGWDKGDAQYVWPVRSGIVFADGFGSGDIRRW